MTVQYNDKLKKYVILETRQERELHAEMLGDDWNPVREVEDDPSRTDTILFTDIIE